MNQRESISVYTYILLHPSPSSSREGRERERERETYFSKQQQFQVFSPFRSIWNLAYQVTHTINRCVFVWNYLNLLLFCWVNFFPFWFFFRKFVKRLNFWSLSPEYCKLLNRGKMKMEMNWWNKMVIPMRKVWGRVSRRIRFRNNGQFIFSLHELVPGDLSIRMYMLFICVIHDYVYMGVKNTRMG